MVLNCVYVSAIEVLYPNVVVRSAGSSAGKGGHRGHGAHEAHQSSDQWLTDWIVPDLQDPHVAWATGSMRMTLWRPLPSRPFGRPPTTPCFLRARREACRWRSSNPRLRVPNAAPLGTGRMSVQGVLM